MTKTNLSAALRAAFPHTIPIMTGYLAVGLAYGGSTEEEREKFSSLRV